MYFRKHSINTIPTRPYISGEIATAAYHSARKFKEHVGINMFYY